MEVDLGLVEAAALEGAQASAFLRDLAVIDYEPGNPGLGRHLIGLCSAGMLGREGARELAAAGRPDYTDPAS
jgi:hypothetical protein